MGAANENEQANPTGAPAPLRGNGMTKGKAFIGLVVIVGMAGWAASSGMLGDTEELAKWFPPLKWVTGDKAAAQSKPGSGGPPQRAVAVEVAKAVKKKTPVLLEAL